jgi:hypothetical protein
LKRRFRPAGLAPLPKGMDDKTTERVALLRERSLQASVPLQTYAISYV